MSTPHVLNIMYIKSTSFIECFILYMYPDIIGITAMIIFSTTPIIPKAVALSLNYLLPKYYSVTVYCNAGINIAE